MKKGLVLIIDDNKVNLKLTRIILETEGYQVRSAMNAEEALELLAVETPHIILMDIQLPGTNGLDLTKQLKADKRYKDIIIIAITAYAMKGDKERTLAAGCDGYISKPIDVPTFPSTIAEYFTS